MKTNSLEARAKLAVHDYSRSISKLKPKIRIIHIVEPEIITTTAEDFQQLVQRLTGKPAVGLERKQSRKQQPKKTEAAVKIEDESVFSTFLEDIDGFFHDVNEFPLLFQVFSDQYIWGNASLLSGVGVVFVWFFGCRLMCLTCFLLHTTKTRRRHFCASSGDEGMTRKFTR